MGKVISVNISVPHYFELNGKSFSTGIFKNPVSGPLQLEKYGVKGDSVMDKRVHGGEHKACYLYPLEHYPYWKAAFPDLSWQYGMFGENITSEGLLEKDAVIGAEYQLGDAIVQVSQPRQPCFKLGYRFGTNEMVKQFRMAKFPGIYFRILREGSVKPGDRLHLIKNPDHRITIADIYSLLMRQTKDMKQLESAIDTCCLADSARRDLQKIQDRINNLH